MDVLLNPARWFIDTVGAYLWAAVGLPGLVGTGVTAIVLLILKRTEAIGFAIPIERTAWAISACIAWYIAIKRRVAIRVVTGGVRT